MEKFVTDEDGEVYTITHPIGNGLYEGINITTLNHYLLKIKYFSEDEISSGKRILNNNTP